MSVEIKYNGETLETIEGGQYATIHTKGKTLGDDIRVEAANVGGGACSGKHYIEVDELPTENIDEEAVYKCGDGFHKWGKTFEDVIIHDENGDIYSLKEVFEAQLGDTFTFHYAETKPTKNILRAEEGNIYYIEDENSVFAYGEDEETGELVWIDWTEDGFPPITATITDASQATEEGAYALLCIGWFNYPLTRGKITILENGTYDVSGIESVVVEIPANAICGQWSTTEIIYSAHPFPLGRKWEQQVNFTVISSDGLKSYTGITHGNKNFLFGITEDGEQEGLYLETGTIFDFGTTPQVVCADLIAFMETYAHKVETVVSDEVLTVTPSGEKQLFSSGVHYKAVIVEAVPTQTLEIGAAATDVTYTPEPGYFYSSVTVKAVNLSDPSTLHQLCGIYLKSFPKTEYVLGDWLSVDGWLCCQYTDGSTQEVHLKYEHIYDIDLQTVGTRIATVKYTENNITCQTTYQYTVTTAAE